MSGGFEADSFWDPDASREYLRSWRSDIERRAEGAKSMVAQMEQLRATGADDNGLAEVTVDSSGVLLDLVLTDRIHRHEPQVVARAVMAALRKARATAAERSQQIAAEALGPDSTSAQLIAERAQQALGSVDGSSVERGQAGAGDGR